MTLWQLILRQIRQRGLSSTLTALGVALGVMLVTAILLLQHQMEEHFLKPGRGYQIVVGAPGSALQLTLNAVYHMDKSPGLMPIRWWPQLEANESVALAVPYAVGDSFHGYRVVATTDALFDRRFPHPGGEDREKLAAGRPFRFDREALSRRLRDLGASDFDVPSQPAPPHPPPEIATEEDLPDADGLVTQHEDDDDDDHDDHELAGHDDHGDLEAVLGAEVAAQLGIHVGDEIEPTHGVEGGQAHDRVHLWKVVGILRHTGTPIDRVVFINLDSFFSIEEHMEGALIPNTNEAGLSSILVFPRPGVHKAILLSSLNREPEITVADVSQQIRNLFSIVGNVDTLFMLVSVLVVILGVLSILVAIYNTMNERRREVAILRAIGARRRTVFGAIVGEASLLTLLGAVTGLALGHLLVWASSGRVEEAAGFVPDPLTFLRAEPLVVGVVVLGGALAGLVPAWKAYRTDVAANLRPLS